MGSVKEWIEKEVARDEVDDYFSLGGAFPVGAFCDFSPRDVCTTTVNTNVNFTADDPLADADTSTIDKPCTRCSYDYGTALTNICYNMTCEMATCDPPTNASVVEFCVTQSRSDSFSVIEFQSDTRYTCRQRTTKKVYAVEYEKGVNNVLHTEFVITDAVGTGNEEGTLEECTFILDGTDCKSCTLCTQDDPGLAAIDCSNIEATAVTTCATDLFDGIEPISGWSPKLIVLEEGFVHTDAPTSAPTSAPTKSPTTPSSAVHWSAAVLTTLAAFVGASLLVL